MKRMTNAALSLAMVLVLLLQLAGPVAFADDPSALTGQEPIGYEAWLLKPADGPESEPTSEQITEENRAELLGDKTFSLKLGEQELPAVADGTVRLDSLREEDHDLVITPPAGYRVSALELLAENERTVKCALPSHLDAADSTVLTVKGKDLLDKDGEYSAKLFKDFTEESVSGLILRVEFTPIDEDEELTLRYDLKGVDTSVDPASVTLAPGESHKLKAPAAPEVGGKSFAGWLLCYDNGASVAVAPDTEITPYADCTLKARWKNILTVTANAPVQNDSGEFVANGYTDNGNLAEGDSIREGSVSLTVEESEGQSWVVPSGASVSDSQGKDVSSRYVIRYQKSEAVSRSRGGAGGYRIEVHGGSADKSEASAGETITLTASDAAPGMIFDKWSVVLGGMELADVNASSTTFVMPASDVELTATFKNLPRTPLTITAASAEKAYDGKPLKASEVNKDGFENGYKITGLADGHKLVSGLSVSGELTKHGTQESRVSVDNSTLKIIDAKDKDVTGLYEIKAENLKTGTLTVTKRTLTITPISKKLEYTGKPVAAAALSEEGFTNGYKVEGLPDSSYTPSQLTVLLEDQDTKQAQEQINAGKYKTVIKEKLEEFTVSKDSALVTDCFDIQLKTGTLQITQRPVTISAVTATLSLESITGTIYAKNIRGGDGYDYGFKATGLLEGHAVKGDFVTGSISEPGELKSDIDKDKVKIVDKDGKDVTANYTISTVPGKVNVRLKSAEKTAITVTATASKVYDATPLTIGNSHIRVTQGALPANYKIEAEFNPSSITDVQKISVELRNVKIKDDKGKDVTDQYNIKVNTGSMEVTRMPLTLTAESASKTYDGKALVNRNVRATALASKNHDLSVEYEVLNSEGKVIKNGAVNVGTYTKRISSVTIKEGSKDVTNNYAITRVEGKLTINAASGNAKNNAKNPRTGDESNLLLWLCVMLASAVLLVLATIVLARKGKLKLSRGPRAPRTPRKPRR